MNFNDEILLNDTEPCIIASKTNVHGVFYYLLINTNTLEEKICYESNGMLLEIGIDDINSDILRKLISLYKVNLNTPINHIK